MNKEDNDDPFSEFGESFKNFETAKKNILSAKDNDISDFQNLIKKYSIDNLKGDSESLLNLEKLYYEIYFDNKKPQKIERADFEKYLSIYFMKILVDNNIAKWKVVKNPFSKENYNLAIEFDNDNWTTGGFAIELYENEKDYGRKYLSIKLKESLK